MKKVFLIILLVLLVAIIVSIIFKWGVGVVMGLIIAWFVFMCVFLLSIPVVGGISIWGTVPWMRKKGGK